MANDSHNKSHMRDAQQRHLSQLFGDEDVAKPSAQQAQDQSADRGRQLSQAAQRQKSALGSRDQAKLAELSQRNDLAAEALKNMRDHARQQKADTRTQKPATAPGYSSSEARSSNRSSRPSASNDNVAAPSSGTPPPRPRSTKPPSPEELDRLLRQMAQRAAARQAPGAPRPTMPPRPPLGAPPRPESAEFATPEAPPEPPPDVPEEAPEKNQEKQAEILTELRQKEAAAQQDIKPVPQPDQERALEEAVKVELPVTTGGNAVAAGPLHDALEQLRTAQRTKEAESQVQGVNEVHRQMPNHPLATPEAKKRGWGFLSKDEKKIVKKLERVLLEVRIPRHRTKEGDKPVELKEELEISEQLITSLHAIYRGGLTNVLFEQDSISLEIASSDGVIGWYLAVPLHLQSLVEKQVHAYFPDAEITPVPLYNIFSEEGYVATRSLALNKKGVYPIKTYPDFEADPMAGLAGALANLSGDEGAAIQIMIAPTGNRWRAKGQAIARGYAQGKGGATGTTSGKLFGGLFKFGGELLNAATTSTKDQEKATARADEPRKLTQTEEDFVEKIEGKSGKVGFTTVVRIVAAAPDRAVAEANLDNIAKAFVPYTAPDLNGFKQVIGPVSSQSKLVTRYVLRELEGAGKKVILNSQELASLWHPPTKDIKTPHVRWLGAKAAPPPSDVPKEGLMIGYNQYRGQTTEIKIAHDDRRRHMYTVGKTGMGKSTLLENMILQDIRAGAGVCFIDPHGDTAEKILHKIPRERAEDVIYFDPGDTERPMAFNMLDYQTPEQKDFLVQECVAIFYKLFGEELIGPKFEHWTRNGILTLMEDEETGAVLFDLPRLYSEREFANHKIAKVKDPVVKSFWQREMAQTSDFHKSEMLGYFISKFGRFITNEMMRNIIGQPKSAFDIRQVMDEGKILIMNLSKGKTGEINSALLGMIAVSKVQMAAMSRVDLAEDQRKDFYLYVDEFQNLTNEESIQSILSEARKYRLNLVIAHQYIAQLEEKVRDAVFGNVGTAVSFGVGADDAEYLEKQFEPVFDAHDLVNLDKHNAYTKLVVGGLTGRAFNMKTYTPETVSDDEQQVGEAIRKLSRLKYGRDKRLVDYEIRMRSKL